MAAVDPRHNALYALIDDSVVRAAAVQGVAERFGFTVDQVELRLYVGRFSGGTNEPEVRPVVRNASGRRSRGGQDGSYGGTVEAVPG